MHKCGLGDVCDRHWSAEAVILSARWGSRKVCIKKQVRSLPTVKKTAYSQNSAVQSIGIEFRDATWIDTAAQLQIRQVRNRAIQNPTINVKRQSGISYTLKSQMGFYKGRWEVRKIPKMTEIQLAICIYRIQLLTSKEQGKPALFLGTKHRKWT